MDYWDFTVFGLPAGIVFLFLVVIHHIRTGNDDKQEKYKQLDRKIRELEERVGSGGSPSFSPPPYTPPHDPSEDSRSRRMKEEAREKQAKEEEERAWAKAENVRGWIIFCTVLPLGFAASAFSAGMMLQYIGSWAWLVMVAGMAGTFWLIWYLGDRLSHPHPEFEERMQAWMREFGHRDVESQWRKEQPSNTPHNLKAPPPFDETNKK